MTKEELRERTNEGLINLKSSFDYIREMERIDSVLNKEIKLIKIMEKKNYEFKAFDSKNNEIEMKHAMVFYGITEEKASGIRMGIAMGLYQKYAEPRVVCRELNAAETAEREQEFYKKFI